jgi:hypothetical protein
LRAQSVFFWQSTKGETMQQREQVNGNLPLLPGKKPQEVSRVSGALSRIRAGLFGIGNSDAGKLVTPGGDFNPAEASGPYRFHEGDLFNPGAENYVFDSPYELPMQTIWGNAFLRTPNTFNPLQSPQVYSWPNVKPNGIGGLVAGQMALQGLEFDEDS